MASAGTKKGIVEAIVDGENVLIHLDPRRDGVKVPKRFRRKPHLILEIGKDMLIPIPDLEIMERGICATLSFSRKPFRCFLPWASIYAAVGKNSSRGMVWTEDVPKEVRAEFSFQAPGQPGPYSVN